MSILACCLTTTVRGADLENSATARVSFLQAPKESPTFTIPLAVVGNATRGQSDYLTQRSSQPLNELPSLPPEIAEAYSNDQHFAFQFAELSNGTRYIVVINHDDQTKFLNRSGSEFWYARIYRIGSGNDSKPELLREGLQSFGGDLTIPVDLPLPGIGTTRLKNIHGSIGYSINGSQNGKPEVYSGRSPTLQVAGSNVSDEGKLTLTATVPDELAVTPDVQLTLRFEPLDPSLPERTASGKITDLLTLGTARFAVTSLAPDFSSATLAVVSGSLKQTLQQQLKAGAEMPPFSQMNLLTRQTITREDLLTGAKNSAGIVFIFGDLQSETGQSFPGYPPSFRGPGSVLPLPPSAVVEQVCVGLKSKVVVVLVTRQISLGFLYGDLRNQTPDYLILSDFIDPLQTAFQLPQSRSRGWSGPSFPIGRDQPSLRQLFNLPEQTLSIVAFNRMGKVLYVKADAGNTFLTSLAEARSALSDQGK